MYYQKQNPFRKSTIFQNLYPQKRYTQILINNNTSNTNNNNNSLKQSRIDNPFQKSNYEQIFSRKNYQSQNKDIYDDNRYRGTFLPLTRYQARMRLKQIDTQLWKRQKQQEQRYKLSHFGPDALRYTSYSNPHTTFMNKITPSEQPNKFVVNKNINQQNQRYLDRKRQVFDEAPRSQYLVYGNQQKTKQKFNNKFAESSTSISHNNGNTYKKFNNNHYQDRNTQKISRFQENQSPQLFNQYQYKPRIINEHEFNQQNPSSTEILENNQSAYFKNANPNLQVSQDYNKISGALYASYNQMLGNDQKFNEKPLDNQQRYFDPAIKNDLNQQYGIVNNSNNLNKMSAGSNFSYERPKPQRKNSYGSDYVNEEEQKQGPLDPMKFSSSESSESPFSNTRELKPSRFGNNKSSVRWPQSIYYEGCEFYRINI